MLNFKWLSIAALFFASISGEPVATPTTKTIKEGPIQIESCKPFPECEIENLESQI